MSDFHYTLTENNSNQSDLTRLINVLENLSLHIEQSNQLKERQLKIDEKLVKLQIKNLNESIKPNKVS